MRSSISPLAPLLCLQAFLLLALSYNFTETSLVPRQLTVFDKRPDDCPPCFNCNLDDFKCYQFANCTQSSGRCSCPPGFGGDDCSAPLCGSLADGNDRPPRRSDEHECKCEDGWEGINCNVCTSNDACNALMPELKDGVCYRDGLVQKENHQMCDVTNKKIVSILDPRRPQVTFSCNQPAETCNFQFWVDQNEAFYCALDTCTYDIEADSERNTTKYACENIHCRCIPGRTLCGEGGLDIGDFLKNEIKGPGSFTSISSYTDKTNDGSKFEEPAMNNLISQVFGDDSITLQCHGGECLYKTDVPGYEKPIKTINTPLIAGVISGSALFVVAAILVVAWLSRRSATRQYGLVRLSDDDEADPALMADHKPASLHFENVSYRVGGRQILSGVQGAVHPGEIMAIMGSSGAGKTTFLDLLARKNKRGVSLGDYYVNGERVPDSEFRSFVGFVDQDDTLLPTLTVHETILDSAMLRLPRDMPLMAKEQKVEDVERQLGIFHIRDQLVGSEETDRGISGGEKRRVSIACELVTSPSILFLDEPTSGLDAYNAYNVVECLVTLVKTYNRTVVFTIHQPRSNIVALFDRLILLAKGRTVYSGAFANCQQYFDSIGYSCPPGFNIADYLVDLTMHAGVQRAPLDDMIDAELGRGTRSSSVMGVKSVASKSNVGGNASSLSSSPAPDGLKRPGIAQRQLSIRQQQEQTLFTQRNSVDQGPDSPRSEPDGGDEPRDSSSWLRLSRQSGGVPPRAFDDPHDLPPETFATTGTDLDNMITSYYTSDVAASIQQDIRNVVSQAAEERNAGDANGTLREASRRVKGYRKIGLLGQFRILSLRTWRNLYRDPMLMLTHYAIAILLAVLIGFLFYGLTDDIPGFQNRLGLLFFVLALFGFSTLTSLTVFANERLIFVRERAKGYYHPVAYFAAKIIFDIVPLRLIPPVILSVVVYPMTGLIAAWHQFSIFVAILVLFNFAAAAMCLFIGIVFRNGGVANLIGSLVMLFSLLFAGLLLNHDSIPSTVRWLQMSSIFHYGFEGLIVNEVRYLSLTEHKWGLDIEVPGASILSSFGFNVQAMVTDIVGLSIFTATFIVLGYLAMHLLLVERR